MSEPTPLSATELDAIEKCQHFYPTGEQWLRTVRDRERQRDELQAIADARQGIITGFAETRDELRRQLVGARKDTERLLAVATGCHDYGGGYRGNSDIEQAQYLAFQHGIQTVVNALTAALKNDPHDMQTAVLESIGREAIGCREGGRMKLLAVVQDEGENVSAAFVETLLEKRVLCHVYDCPSAEELGRAALNATTDDYAQNRASVIGQAILECIRRKPA